MFWLQAIVAVAIVCGTVLIASGRGSGTTLDELPVLDPVLLPDDEPVRPDDVTDLRLGVGLRGYRMDEVDEVLDRLTGELAERDATIERLSARYEGTPAVAAGGAPAVRDAATWGDPDRQPGAATAADPAAAGLGEPVPGGSTDDETRADAPSSSGS